MAWWAVNSRLGWYRWLGRELEWRQKEAEREREDEFTIAAEALMRQRQSNG